MSINNKSIFIWLVPHILFNLTNTESEVLLLFKIYLFCSYNSLNYFNKVDIN